MEPDTKKSEFGRLVRKASQEVKSWPAWKQASTGILTSAPAQGPCTDADDTKVNPVASEAKRNSQD